jgi:hypothetical protein
MPSPPPKKIEGFPYGWIWRARSSGWRAIAEALVSVDGGADKEDKVAARRPTPEPFQQRRIGSCSNAAFRFDLDRRQSCSAEQAAGSDRVAPHEGEQRRVYLLAYDSVG